MLIPPKYRITAKISEYLSSIEASKAIIDSITIAPEIENNIRRRSTLKNSLFSARIEGNPLTLEDYIKTPSADQKKREIFNLLKALNKVHKHGARDVTLNTVLDLHKLTMDKLSDSENWGKIRRETSAIFNTAGIAIYLPPPPRHIPSLVKSLVKFINSSKESSIPIRSCLAHYSFEKVHPFTDGNGRVGRLLIQLVLQKGGYGMKSLISIEEYLDQHRSLYYQMLMENQKDVTPYLEFMLEAIAHTAEKAREEVLVKKDAKPQEYLLPRRTEILNIIKDHKIINFNTIKRRFSRINDRTLRFDLKKLADQGLIRKLGTTRGAYYESV